MEEETSDSPYDVFAIFNMILLANNNRIRGNKEMKAIFNNKNFVKLWFGQLVSILGDQIYFIALMVLIQNYYGNVVITGTVMMITAIPKILFSPFAGVLVDRWSLKITMVVSDLIRMIMVLMIPVFFHYLQIHNMMVIFIMTFLISTVSVFFYPAKSASIPALVEKNNLIAANSLSGTTQTIVSLFGLLGGAVLVSIIGTNWSFVMDSISFLISAISVLLILYPEKQKEENTEELNVKVYFRELKSGAKYIYHNKLLRFMLAFFASIMLLGGAINVLMFAYIEDILHRDASLIGFIGGANMIGMLIGIAAIAKITKKYPKEKLLVWSTFIFALTFSSVAGISSLPIVLVIMVINGLGNGILNVVSETVFQEHVAEAMRGRVFSVIDASINSAAILSMLPAAWLAKTFGVTNVFLAAGIILFIIFLISLKKVNRLFTLNHTEDIEIDKAEVNSI